MARQIPQPHDITVIVQRRPDPARRKALIDLLLELGWGNPPAVDATPKERLHIGDLRHCCSCKRALPVDRFLTITERQTRPSGKVYTYRGPSYDCRDCRNEAKREARRMSAERAGRTFEPRGDRTAWEAAGVRRRAERRAERQARYQAHLDEQERVRQHRRESPELECAKCREIKPRAEFYVSTVAIAACRSCVDAASMASWARARDELADRYVKQQIAKMTGLHHPAIPTVLIEAKRAQLMLQRALPETVDLFAAWLANLLRDGPVDATLLNQLAKGAGYNLRGDRTLKRMRRTVGATYDATTNTWRMQ